MFVTSGEKWKEWVCLSAELLRYLWMDFDEVENKAQWHFAVYLSKLWMDLDEAVQRGGESDQPFGFWWQYDSGSASKWLGGVMVRTLDVWSVRCGFDSQASCYQVVTTRMGDFCGQVNNVMSR